MKRSFTFCAAASFVPWTAWMILLAGHGAASPTESDRSSLANPASVREEYTNFKLISDRNIFNSNRASRSAAGAQEQKTVQVETVALVGTLCYEKGPYAFFDGSSSEFRKVLETGQTIVGYKIAGITGNSVQLESGTNTVELHIGMQLRREDQSQWHVSGDILAQPLTGNDTKASFGEKSPETEDAVIQRMIQQREQEIK